MVVVQLPRQAGKTFVAELAAGLFGVPDLSAVRAALERIDARPAKSSRPAQASRPSIANDNRSVR